MKSKSLLIVSVVLLVSGGLRPVFGLTADAQGMVSYESFNGGNYTFKPWLGRNIVLLAPDLPRYQTNIMVRIVAALDRAYDFYESATARKPVPSDTTTFRGRDTISVVNSTCGAGCSQVGLTGMEILTQYFQILYSSVSSANQFDQVLFYEFGRNFWFYSSKLAYDAPDKDPVVTGYAVYMRFASMQAAGVAGAPFNGSSFTSFASAVTNLMDLYVRSVSLTWSNTFRISTAPPNSFGLGGTDLIASLLMHVGRDFGGPRFALNFWKQVELRPDATSTVDAANNLLLAACATTGVNLSQIFATNWKWPVTAAAFKEAQDRWGPPVPFPIRLIAQSGAGAGLKFSWQSQVHSLYQPQESSNLESWFDVGDPVPGNGSVLSLQNATGPEPERFFRMHLR